MSRIAVVRMCGEAKVGKQVLDTFRMLGMKRMYSARVFDRTPVIAGMVKKVDNFAAWGETTDETEKLLASRSNLKPPKGGFRSKKLRYPRGNLGYCGKTINDMIKKMV